MKAKLPPRRSKALRQHVAELNASPTDRYVDVLKMRGGILTVGDVDVDLEQLVERTFLCDRHRCIQWRPHTHWKGAEPIIDRSCCSHYDVPVTKYDRVRLMEVLPLVKKRLPADHALNQGGEPFDIDGEFQTIMNTTDQGTCQFVLYEDGMTTCAVHKTCLEENLPVWVHKPAGCSLWPLAVVDYEDADGNDRFLVTTYGAQTNGLFADAAEREDDDNHFACMVDAHEDYEPLYRSCTGILTHLFGPELVKELDKFTGLDKADAKQAAAAKAKANGKAPVSAKASTSSSKEKARRA